jgi:hypothetical protein
MTRTRPAADELIALTGVSPRQALAAALRDARADACHATAGDPVVTAAGWSFIVLGA